MFKKIGLVLLCSLYITGMEKFEKKSLPETKDNQYAWLFKRLPEQYHPLLWAVIEEKIKLPLFKKENKTIVQDEISSDYVINWYAPLITSGDKVILKGKEFEGRLHVGWLLCSCMAYAEGLLSYYYRQNIFFKNSRTSLFKGKRLYKKHSEKTCNLKAYADKKYTLCGGKEHFEQALVGYYKIHIMPHDEDVLKVVERIIQALKDDKDMQKLIDGLKIYGLLSSNNKLTLTTSKLFPAEQYWPAIVIYPSWGQENVQKLLGILIVVLKDFKGSDHLPRYNLKVNDLIFYAQGDADHKMDDTLRETYFDGSSNYALYKDDITGKKQDYHLKF